MPSQFSNRNFLTAFALLILFNTLVLGYYHNRFWWPPDDGVYAHTAERMLNGEVLNKDVEEIHTGYIHFIDVAAFALFGVQATVFEVQDEPPSVEV